MGKFLRWAFAIGCLQASSAYADTSEGRVVRVADGDSLTVLVGSQRVRIRLLEIDAPESKQKYGKEARQSLSDLCSGKTAKIEWTQKDQYGRTLGRVYCEGVDVNAEQVRRGLAWVFDRYVRDRSFYALQDQARAERKGLWADESPMAPWEWRRQKKIDEIGEVRQR